MNNQQRKSISCHIKQELCNIRWYYNSIILSMDFYDFHVAVVFNVSCAGNRIK